MYSGLRVACCKSQLEILSTPVDVNVVLLDLTLPGMNGLEALVEIHKLREKLPVLLLSMHPKNAMPRMASPTFPGTSRHRLHAASPARNRAPCMKRSPTGSLKFCA
ncbi:response regulator [Telmatobacter bradus]|uniref:response regulator n=1 Tax=Telmatobacter bradus TaxID=474953 RepID=UPI003B42F63F